MDQQGRGWSAYAMARRQCPVLHARRPLLRSQRVFTVVVQVLVSMALSCLFFQSEEYLAESEENEQLRNGLQASLLTAACALPVIGCINVAFAWLRRPLTVDVMLKSGDAEIHIKEETARAKTDRASRSRRCQRRLQ